MIEIIFTSRPISFKPISWVNAITRAVTRSPFDHVSLKYNGHIYESTAKDKLNTKGGVHKCLYQDWIKYREGSYLIVYQLDIESVDLFKFSLLEGKPYDYPANFWFLLGIKKMLKKKPNKRIFCSELIASMLWHEKPYEMTPSDLEEELRPLFDCYIDKI